MNLNQYETMEKEKNRELKRRYDNELATQIQIKNRLTQQGM
jgi:hypothetical protein